MSLASFRHDSSSRPRRIFCALRWIDIVATALCVLKLDDPSYDLAAAAKVRLIEPLISVLGAAQEGSSQSQDTPLHMSLLRPKTLFLECPPGLRLATNIHELTTWAPASLPVADLRASYFLCPYFLVRLSSSRRSHPQACSRVSSVFAHGPPSFKTTMPPYFLSAPSSPRQDYDHLGLLPPPPHEYPTTNLELAYAIFVYDYCRRQGGPAAQPAARRAWAAMNANQRKPWLARAIGGDRRQDRRRQEHERGPPEYRGQRREYREQEDLGQYRRQQYRSRANSSCSSIMNMDAAIYTNGQPIRRSPSPRSMMMGAGLPEDHPLMQDSLHGGGERKPSSPWAYPTFVEDSPYKRSSVSSAYTSASSSSRGGRRDSDAMTAVSDVSSMSSTSTMYDEKNVATYLTGVDKAYTEEPGAADMAEAEVLYQNYMNSAEC
ncbi:hypothetical protein BD626DRAFT_483971 [Schizophyllum amplum]|uniref:Uncharacterized protein n=1 Tax=Schizophyllum amplum TaxID=97359 RepID=A0A550CPV0_9AGAR|nr:hypothetical protein BD626DRAFT_483971 [Auriculariopsis ampla]